MNAERAGERLGFFLAELRELRGDVLHGTMPLAQLNTGQRGVIPHRSGGGREALLGQCVGERLGAVVQIRAGRLDDRAGLLGHRVGALAGELGDGVVAGGVAQELQHRAGQRVVVAAQPGVPDGGDHERPGGATAFAFGGAGRLVLLDEFVVREAVQVAPHGRRGETERIRELGRRDGAALGDRSQHAIPRADLATDKHNISVT